MFGLKCYTVFCFIVYLELNHSLPCTIESGLIGASVFENAPNGTLVTTLYFEGRYGYELHDILLDRDLDNYFELNKTDGLQEVTIYVKDSTNMNRYRFPIMQGVSFAEINGYVACYDIYNQSITWVTGVHLFYTNNYPSQITSPGQTSQSENFPINTILPIYITKTDNGDPTTESCTYSITGQTPAGYFDVDSISGKFSLLKSLNYTEYQNHTVDIQLTNTGPDSNGDEVVFNDYQTLTIQIEGFDYSRPIFLPCNNVCPPLYTTSMVTSNTYDSLNIFPGPIIAIDGDTGINQPIIYSFADEFTSESETFYSHFVIDEVYGQVSVIQPILSASLITLTVKAEQTDNPDRYSVAYLQVTVLNKDEYPPAFLPDIYEGDVVDDGSQILFVYEKDSNTLIHINVIDEDNDPNAILMMEMSAATPFKITPDGKVYVENDQINFNQKTYEFQVTAKNMDPDIADDNRYSTQPATVTVWIRDPEPESKKTVTLKTFWITTGILLLILLVTILVIVIYFIRTTCMKNKNKTKKPQQQTSQLSPIEAKMKLRPRATLPTEAKKLRKREYRREPTRDIDLNSSTPSNDIDAESRPEEARTRARNVGGKRNNVEQITQVPPRPIKPLPGMQIHRPSDVPLSDYTNTRQTMSAGHYNNSFDTISNGSDYEPPFPAADHNVNSRNSPNKATLNLYNNKRQEQVYEVTI
ncbi:uncharacterized protein LOC120329942 isoform X1 [Styela clava]